MLFRSPLFSTEVQRSSDDRDVCVILFEGTFTEGEFINYVMDESSPKAMRTPGECNGLMITVPKRALTRIGCMTEGMFWLNQFQYDSWCSGLQDLSNDNEARAMDILPSMMEYAGSFGLYLGTSPRQISLGPIH